MSTKIIELKRRDIACKTCDEQEKTARYGDMECTFAEKEIKTVGDLLDWLAPLARENRIRCEIELLQPPDIENASMYQLGTWIHYNDEDLAVPANDVWRRRYGHDFPIYGAGLNDRFV